MGYEKPSFALRLCVKIEACMDCPGETPILEFVEGTLPREGAEAIHQHLDGCTLCQSLVAELARADESITAKTVREAEPPVLERGATVDRYIILERLGVGGMGVVYAAFDPQLDRKVALKLLRPDVRGTAEEQRSRLLHEAQALARLSHPNVVTVYEARAAAEQLFVVIELVEGTTLDQWLRERERPWREVLEVFLKAGQGLWAAHEAGLVHRDFKPSNVLIGKDGRVRVTDFGLARLSGRDVPIEARRDEDRAHLPRSVTRTGTVLGTPAYMAPEQWEGRATDARSDQFAFCVAVYEGLYGARPFRGDDLDRLSQAVRAGLVPAAPRGTRVPNRVRRVLLRGLQVDPSGRYPSMRELLADLSRDPFALGRGMLAAVAAVVLLAMGVAIGGGRAVDPAALICGGSERNLSGIWDGKRKGEVREALLAAATPIAEDAWRGVERELDTYAKNWTDMHRESCEATRIRRERSEALMDLQVMCLERRARDLKALTDYFIRVRDKAVVNAVKASYSLHTPLKECAEMDGLTAQVKRPSDQKVKNWVEGIDSKLSEVRTLSSAGEYVSALEKAEALVNEARDLSYEPTRAEVFYELGVLRMINGQAQQARQALSEAAWAAEAGHHDRFAALARIDLVVVSSTLERQPDATVLALRDAQAALERYGANPEMQCRLESAQAGAFLAEDKCEKALEHINRALELADKAYELHHPQRALILDNYALDLRCIGHLDEAQKRAEEALKLRERAFGTNHPEVANSLNTLANIMSDKDLHEKSHDLHQRALEIRRAALGRQTVVVADALMNVGIDLTKLKRNAESITYMREALSIYENSLGVDSPKLALLLLNVGHVEVELNNPEGAIKALDRALDILKGHEEDKVRAVIRFNLAKALRKARRDAHRAHELAIQSRTYLARRKDANHKVLSEIDQWLEDRTN